MHRFRPAQLALSAGIALFWPVLALADEQGGCLPTGIACGSRGIAPCPQGSQSSDGCHFVKPSNAHRPFVSKIARDYYVVNGFAECPLLDCGFTLEIRAVENYGGHCQHIGTRPTGDPAAGFYDYPGPVTITHTLPEFGGPIIVIATPNVNCIIMHPQAATMAFYLCVMEPNASTCTAGLVPLPPNPNYVSVPGIVSPEHGDCRYLTLGSVSAFQTMFDLYQSGGGQQTLQIADRSLIWGGAVDRAADWGTSFLLRGHREGFSADIRVVDENNNSTLSDISIGALMGAIESASMNARFEPTVPFQKFLHVYQVGVGGAKFGEDD